MSPKKTPPKKAGKSRDTAVLNKSRDTAVLEAVPSRKAGKGSPAAAPAVKSSSRLEVAPRSTEFIPPTRPSAAAAPAREDGVEGRYVYGIIQASQPKTFGKTAIGAAGENVYTVHHGDVAAVVSKTPV